MSEAAKYRPDIDGLRAIAVLAVVAYHAAPGRLQGGFIGVDVFFVISGYLISSILLNSLQKGTFSVLEFYERRIRRIFPALFIVLLSCAVAGWFFLLPIEFQHLGKHTAAGTVFASNIVLWSESGYFDNGADFKILLHLWSLGIEEQFYIFWPIILWFAYRRKWSLPLTISLLAVASFALNIHLTGTDRSSAFYLPFPRFWELLAGALLACSTGASHGLSTPWRDNIQSAAGMLLLAAGFMFISGTGAFPGWWALMPVIGSALLISAGPQALFNRLVLSNRLMVWVGLISYPLYLWHWPLLSFMRVMEGQEVLQYKRAIAVAAAFVLAALTYHFVEKPVRRNARSKTLVYALVALMAGIGAFGVASHLTGGFKNRSGHLPQVVNQGDIGHHDFYEYILTNFHPCTPERIRNKIKPELGIVRCFQSKPDGSLSVALIGDSHAGHLFPGLAEALPGENLVFYPTGGLPFLSNDGLAETFTYVLGNPDIKTVILAAIWKRKLDDSVNPGWKAELSATIDALGKAGKTVYITDDSPKFSFLPSRCKFDGRLGIGNRCTEPSSVDNAVLLDYLEPLSRQGVQFRVIKTYPAFCSGGSCSMAGQGQLYFRDEHHLNIPGSKKAGRVLAGQMQHPEMGN